MFDIKILEMVKKDLKEGFYFPTETLEIGRASCRERV